MKAVHTLADNIADETDSMTSDVGRSANADRVAGYSITCVVDTIRYVVPDTSFGIGHSTEYRCTQASFIIASSGNILNPR